LPTKAKKSTKTSKAKDEEELRELPPPQFTHVYQPLQQMQGYPGNYAELNPYVAPVQFIPNTSVQN